jgi:hypothetical protein
VTRAIEVETECTGIFTHADAFLVERIFRVAASMRWALILHTLVLPRL